MIGMKHEVGNNNMNIAQARSWNNKTSARGNSFLKFKLNWDRVRVWDASGQELQEFGDLAGRSSKVRVEMRQCWLMPPSWGILMEVTDLMLMEAAPPAARCPF